MRPSINLSYIRNKSAKSLAKAGIVRWKEKESGKVIDLKGYKLKKQLEHEVAGGISRTALKEEIRKRISDYQKRQRVGSIVFNDETRKATMPTKFQIARLYKKISRRGIDPKNHLDVINKLIPKDKELTFESMKEITDDVEKMQNRIRYTSAIARERQENRTGVNKIKNLLTTNDGHKEGYKDRFGYEDPNSGSVVSISDFQKNKGNSKVTKQNNHGAATSSHLNALGVTGGYGAHTPSKSNDDKGIPSGKQFSSPSIGFRKAA